MPVIKRMLPAGKWRARKQSRKPLTSRSRYARPMTNGPSSSPAPLRVWGGHRHTGDRTNHWVVNIGGAEREFDTEITEQRADEWIAWPSTESESHVGAVTFTPLGTATTRVCVRFGWARKTSVDKAAAVLPFGTRQPSPYGSGSS